MYVFFNIFAQFFMRLFILKLRQFILFCKTTWPEYFKYSSVRPARCIVGRSGRASGGRHVLLLEEVWQSFSHWESCVLGTGLSFCRVHWTVSRALGSWCTAADTASGSRCGPRQTHTGKSLQNPLRLPALKDREFTENIPHTRGVSSVAVNETHIQILLRSKVHTSELWCAQIRLWDASLSCSRSDSLNVKSEGT